MDVNDLFDQPEARRTWLLGKALELSPSLEEALKLAQAADEFVAAAPLTLDTSPPLETRELTTSASAWAPEIGAAERHIVLEDEPYHQIGDGRAAPSPREAEILRCLVLGCSNKVIARQLGIVEATVKVHLKAVLRKTRTGNRTQAAIWAVNNGISAIPAATLSP
jgi:DNA-binding NarL/FixJ family response regulator